MIINHEKMLLSGAAYKKLKSFQDELTADRWQFKAVVKEGEERRDSLVMFVSICFSIQDWKSTKGCSQELQSEDSTEVDKKLL